VAVLDTFTGSDGTQLTTHDANWVMAMGGSSTLVLRSNQVGSGTGHGEGDYFAAWTGLGTLADQESIITVGGNSSAWIGPCVRVGGASSGNAYHANCGGADDSTNFCYFGKWVSNAYTNLSQAAMSFDTGAKLKMTAVGTTISVYTDTGSGWVLWDTQTDSSHSSGYPGIAGYAEDAGTRDDFEASDLASDVEETPGLVIGRGRFGEALMGSVAGTPIFAQTALPGMTMAAPAGAALAGALASGSLPNITLAAPAGTLLAGALATGSIPGVTLAAPAGVVVPAVAVSLPGLTLAAPAGTALAGALASGSLPGVTLAAPAGTAAAGTSEPVASGALPGATLAAVTGTAFAEPVATASLPGLTLAAPAGAAIAGAMATGSLPGMTLAAPAGTGKAGGLATASIPGVTMTAPNGSAVVEPKAFATIPGLTFGAPAGVAFTADPRAVGSLPGLTLAAPNGTAAVEPVAFGALPGLTLAAPAGSAAVNPLASGALPNIILFGPSGTAFVEVISIAFGDLAGMSMQAPGGRVLLGERDAPTLVGGGVPSSRVQAPRDRTQHQDPGSRAQGEIDRTQHYPS